MNFFDAQDNARRKTRVLLVLFGFAVILMTVLLSLAAKFAVYLFYFFNAAEQSGTHVESFREWFSLNAFLLITCLMIAVVGYFSYRGFSLLFNGGGAVLDGLGLKRADHQVTNEKLARMIVSEMSLAAGCPVPEVYLINENGINAFSVGWEPSDAAIAVTRGALEHLERDELQALFAHEFSHILNGDMRLNFIMSGLLEGLFFFFEVGSRLLEGSTDSLGHASYRGGSSRGLGISAVMYLGVLLMMVVGGFGFVLGRWIQAIMTRQQSLEADAAAVQFTRDAGSVISLLEKMGRNYLNTYLITSRFERFSHAFIGSAGKRNLLSAHPPLIKRIHAIDPNHEVQLKAINLDEPTPHLDHLVKKKEVIAKPLFMWTALGVGISQAIQGNTQVPEGEIFDETLWESPSLDLYQWAEESPSAISSVLALICASDAQELDSRLKQLKPRLDKHIYDLLTDRIPVFRDLDPRNRVLLLELCFVNLKTMSKVKYTELKTSMNILFNTDFKLDHDEFVIQRLITSRLDRHFGVSRKEHRILRVVGDARREIALVLSLIAYTEHQDDEANAAFNAGIQSIGATSLKILGRNKIALTQVNTALDTLAEMPVQLKRRMLRASAATIALDQKVTPQGFELLRVIAIGLEVPMPALTYEEA